MYKQLNSEQRYTIFILLQNGMNKKQIATAIKVSPSTISRKLKRNSGTHGRYITMKQLKRMQNTTNGVPLAIVRSKLK